MRFCQTALSSAVGARRQMVRLLVLLFGFLVSGSSGPQPPGAGLSVPSAPPSISSRNSLAETGNGSAVRSCPNFPPLYVRGHLDFRKWNATRPWIEGAVTQEKYANMAGNVYLCLPPSAYFSFSIYMDFEDFWRERYAIRFTKNLYYTANSRPTRLWQGGRYITCPLPGSMQLLHWGSQHRHLGQKVYSQHIRLTTVSAVSQKSARSVKSQRDQSTVSTIIRNSAK
jgi:hypothetical protein